MSNHIKEEIAEAYDEASHNTLQWFQMLRNRRWKPYLVAWLLGQCVGVHTFGQFSWGAFVLGGLLTLTGGIFAIMLNNWRDTEADAIKKLLQPGHPHIFGVAQGLIEKKTVLVTAVLAGLLTLGLSVVGGVLLGLGDLTWYVLASAILIGGYSMPPFSLSYRGLGEITQGLAHGLALPLLNAYLQARDWPSVGFWQVFPSMFLFAIGIEVAHSLGDIASDKKVGRLTLASWIGAQKARWLVEQMVRASAFCLIFANFFLPIDDFWLILLFGPSSLSMFYFWVKARQLADDTSFSALLEKGYMVSFLILAAVILLFFFWGN